MGGGGGFSSSDSIDTSHNITTVFKTVMDPFGNILYTTFDFLADIQIELEDESYNLIFENEYQLGTMPKEIDVLVIKKNQNVPIKKNL